MSRKKRSLSQRNWIKRQQADPFVKKAVEMGYPSRAVFKLIEIQEKENLVQKGMRVADLGSAPGSWSKLASEWVSESGSVFAIDLLPMPEYPGVTFIQGDFTDNQVFDELLSVLGDEPLDLVISDMAPNMSGMRSVDQPRSMYLAELVLDFCHKVLKKDGAMVVKVFQGEGFQTYLSDVRKCFERVKLKKPVSSRKSSREQYMIAKGYHLN